MKKRVNFPSKIRIGGHSYKVVYPHIFREEDAVGQCHYTQCKIRIQDTDQGMKRDIFKLKSSFLHELLHIIDHVYNSNKINDSDDGENIIIRLTSGWLQILVDNDLLLDKPYRLPRTVKIGGFRYKVVYPFNFKENGSISSLTAHNTLEFLIGHSCEESDSSIKCRLIRSILEVINTQYIINKEDVDLLEYMTEGIYQVFKDNNIPRIIRGK